MFDIGWSELLLIGVVALIVIGPKELPGALRTLGQWTGKLRRMAAEFQGQFQEAMREAEMADLKKQVDEMATQAQSYTTFDPLGDVRSEIESTRHQIEKAVTSESSAAAASVDLASSAAPAGTALPAESQISSEPGPAGADASHEARSAAAPAETAPPGDTDGRHAGGHRE